jgi:hypothetical protein
MANNGFNGSSVTIASAGQADLLSIDYTKEGAKVQVTGSDATTKLFVAGIPEEGVTFTVAGGTSLDVGDTGAVAISFFDGTSVSLTNSIVVSIGISGSEDSPITSSITLAPTSAA